MGLAMINLSTLVIFDYCIVYALCVNVYIVVLNKNYSLDY